MARTENATRMKSFTASESGADPVIMVWQRSSPNWAATLLKTSASHSPCLLRGGGSVWRRGLGRVWGRGRGQSQGSEVRGKGQRQGWSQS